MFRPGHQEVLVGAAAQAQFVGLDLGSTLRLQGGDWTVTGIFAGGNGSRDSEVVTDAQSLMSIYKGLDGFNTITVMLESASSFAALKELLSHDPALRVDVHTEPDYLAVASDWIGRILRLVAYSIGSIMTLGAVFGALNSMYSAVAARTVEIATLRAIGFAPGAVASAVLLEALLLVLFGAGIGVAIAWAAFNGTTISMLGGATDTAQLVYSLKITPTIIAMSLGTAAIIGLLGGTLPALRAARLNVADALQKV
jgi:putative ABC transport system permease protein